MCICVFFCFICWVQVCTIQLEKISVMHLNIFNSKDKVGGWEGYLRSCDSMSELPFPRFASLPGVWHWLELEMNVAYGNPLNWPTPGSHSFMQQNFPFSKPISCSGRTPDWFICQQRQWRGKTACISTVGQILDVAIHSCRQSSRGQLITWMSLVSRGFAVFKLGVSVLALM